MSSLSSLNPVRNARVFASPNHRANIGPISVYDGRLPAFVQYWQNGRAKSGPVVNLKTSQCWQPLLAEYRQNERTNTGPIVNYKVPLYAGSQYWANIGKKNGPILARL